jgi:DNA mismatch repair protein MutS2
MRVVVDLDDLEPALGQPGGAPGASTSTASGAGTALRLDRARSVASSLDLRGARVEEALDALSRYIDDASLAGLGSVTIIHGLGTGALRDAVRNAADGHPLVGSVRAGERGEGGDGATIVSF